MIFFFLLQIITLFKGQEFISESVRGTSPRPPQYIRDTLCGKNSSSVPIVLDNSHGKTSA
jgi:hypothetical protein